MSNLRQCFDSSPYRSIKHENYFDIYEKELSPFQGKNVTMVEVGVLDGGSLFMWREFFGQNARIVGVDANPLAKRWEEFGFEIEIGDQASSHFWSSFFDKFGVIDLLVDDGGHTNKQQSSTLINCLKKVRPGGLIIVDDTHSSYLSDFGNPSCASIVEFSKLGVDAIQARFPKNELKMNELSRNVWSIRFYESIIVLEIDPSKCKINKLAENSGIILGNETAEDFRNYNEGKLTSLLRTISTIDALKGLSVGNTHSSLKFINFILKSQFGGQLISKFSLPFRYLSVCILSLKNQIENRKVRNSFHSFLQMAERQIENDC